MEEKKEKERENRGGPFDTREGAMFFFFLGKLFFI